MSTSDAPAAGGGVSPPTVPSSIPPDAGLVVRVSTIPDAGRGLFATKPFAAGDRVCVYTGDVLRTKVAIKLPDKAYLMRLGPQCYIDAGNEAVHAHVLARYINDCRNPELHNVRFDKRPDEQCAVVEATRDIHPGDELFVSYGRWYWLKEKGQTLPSPSVASPPTPAGTMTVPVSTSAVSGSEPVATPVVDTEPGPP